jgi:hypothetical protein
MREGGVCGGVPRDAMVRVSGCARETGTLASVLVRGDRGRDDLKSRYKAAFSGDSASDDIAEQRNRPCFCWFFSASTGQIPSIALGYLVLRWLRLRRVSA